MIGLSLIYSSILTFNEIMLLRIQPEMNSCMDLPFINYSDNSSDW